MTRRPFIIALIATAALAGCNEDHTIVAGPPSDEQSNSAANAPVELPPSIASSKIYRCGGDNSVVYVDWLSDNKTANVRTEDNGSPTQVAAAEEGKPLTAPSGLSVTGNPTGSTIQVTLPGGGSKSCKA